MTARLPRNFTMVSPDIWTSQRFLSLSDAAKLLFLYYLTSTFQTSAGCFRLPDKYACADLEWELSSYCDTRRALLDAGLIQFDPETSEVLIERWFRHSPPTNSKHYRGVMGFIEKIKSEQLRTASLHALPKDFAPAAITRFGDAGADLNDKPYDLTRTRSMKSVGR